ncbi:hypothetical protein ACHAWF_013008, partial [Thalassiosira exigua]
ELDPETNGPTVCPTIDAIRNSPPGSTILVGAHTSSIYFIMDYGRQGRRGRRGCEGLGIDTSDPIWFPKRRSTGHLPKSEYDNVWKVEIDKNGTA